MAKYRGSFIVIYAPPNMGKSKQLDLLEDLWRQLNGRYIRLKYPIYDSETGRRINEVLREGKPMSDEELQYLFAENRREFQPTLEMWLSHGFDVLAEDYTATGLARGLTQGVSRPLLDEYNRGLLEPNISILLDGERFSSGIEKGHRFEEGGKWEQNRQIHLELAREFGWEIVNANQSPELVHEAIKQKIFGFSGVASAS